MAAGIGRASSATAPELIEFHVPDRHGGDIDVVLGLGSLEEYIESWACMGASCGRYGNRIRRGELIVEGERHQLPLNWREHHLHGGPEGFDRRIRRAEIRQNEDAVAFSLTSPDGDQGYPGESQQRSFTGLKITGSRLQWRRAPPGRR